MTVPTAVPCISDKGTSAKLALRLLFLALFAATPLFAQFGASSQGTVQDQSGAVIPGATITITPAGNHTPRTHTSSAEGFYRFSELPPGSYTVVVSAANFKSSTSNNVAIAAETPRSLDIKLTPGGASETVTVNASDTSGLQTADATISGPCYVDMDMSFAKEQSLEAMGHNLQLRFQANFFNIFNQETLTPFSNGNANQAALIESTTFGQAQSANAGRVLEFLVRLQF